MRAWQLTECFELMIRKNNDCNNRDVDKIGPLDRKIITKFVNEIESLIAYKL